jgi:hypothetical protein
MRTLLKFGPKDWKYKSVPYDDEIVDDELSMRSGKR